MGEFDAEDMGFIHRMAAGDQESLYLLFSRYRDRIWRYLWHQLGDDLGLVEEVGQDVFLAAWKAAPTYQQKASVQTWLFHIARNRAVSALRHRGRGTPLLLPMQTEMGDSR